ncbi:MAG: endonuclease III [Elusimicrobiales bacterium]|nr:endonuclease III [Elusimicrobiales bacterium]
MKIKKDSYLIVNALKAEFPNASTELKYLNPFQLLIATILSAQTTDITVNKVTPILFNKYPDAFTLSKANLSDVEDIIRPTGFYHQKAKYIVETSKIIMDKFNGKVPQTMEGLMTLKGVSRKTANVVISNVFDKAEGIVVDTHVKRVAKRTGFSSSSNAIQIEKDLMNIFDKKDWAFLSNALVLHGRYICKARNPMCEKCKIEKWCEKNF